MTNQFKDRSKIYLTLGIVALVSSFIFIFLAYAVDSSGFLHRHLLGFDDFFNNYFSTHQFSLGVDILMLLATYLVSPAVMIGALVVLFLILVIVHRRYLSAFFLAGLAIGGILDFVFKMIFERARPVAAFYSVSQPGYSFPSAHALIATVFYGFLGFCFAHAFRKRWQKVTVSVLAGLIVFLVGVSRVFLGVHFASDVIGGWAVGLVLLALLIFIFYHAHDHIHAPPFAFPHGPTMIFISVILLLLGALVWHFFSISPLVLVQ
jgi:undecaprenyl-diphosphatase